MKAAATLLLSAALATTAAADQKILKQPELLEPSHADLLSKIEHGMKSLGEEAHAIFEDISALLPESLDRMRFQAPPKPHQRKHDSEWDYITKGADIQALWTTNEAGEQEREIEGKLENFTLRTKKLDPKSLGVDNVTQYSGYLDDEEEDKHLFYWFFESRNDPKNDPVVLWLNGGPGCSSLTGLFLELGPSFVTKKLGLDYNPYSWNANASVIFLDQPVNVGYSYSGGSVGTTEAASKDVYALLTLFFKRFPEYAKQDFHISGESYAGHYIPSFAHEILSHKKRNINLKSVLIGNGLTDGLTQYKYYTPMACGEGGWPAVVDESTCKTMDEAYPQCASLIQNCYDSESVWMCVPAAIYCNNAMLAPYQQTGANVYDVRGPCEDPENLCYPQLGWIQEYLNKDNVKEALGAEVSNYESCNMGINQNFLFHGDWMLPFHRLVPDLLSEIGVLVYAGDADFICNWLGNLAWTEALEWPGQKDYNKAKMEDLTLLNSKHKTGSVKTSGNFTFIRLHAGGHMVPHDQPEASADMFNRWIGGEWLKGL